MRGLIFSDTHGNVSLCKKAIEAYAPLDLIIHLGDNVRDAYALFDEHPDIRGVCVCGNCDYGAEEDGEKVVSLSDKKLFICHGHTYSDASLVRVAKEKGCFAALCGHSHIKRDTMSDGVRLINPGSASLPRDGARSFAIVEWEGERADFVLVDWM